MPNPLKSFPPSLRASQRVAGRGLAIRLHDTGRSLSRRPERAVSPCFELPGFPVAEYPARMRWLYVFIQLAVFAATCFWIVSTSAAQGREVVPLVVILIAAAATVVVTALLYWSIRGFKRLLGNPPEGRVVTPPGAFDNLRRGNPNQIEH